MCREKAALKVQRFDFDVTFLGRGRVSRNWGPTLRGGFGRCLRKVACSLGRDSCNECALGAACAYGYIFETPILPSAAVMRKYPQAPHPFVFEPNEENHAAVEPGQSVRNSLVVVGEAVRYLPYFFVAIEELGREGLGRDEVVFQVDRVVASDGKTIMDRQRGRRFEQAEARPLSLEPGRSRLGPFQISLQTPTRIAVDGRITAQPTLIDIVKALCRRAFLLRYFHCGFVEEPVPSEFIAVAAEAKCLASNFVWHDAKRFSTRQEREVPLGGVLGSGVWEGDIGALEPLLRVGEFVHVGKNTTFGLGKFVLSEGEGL
jgi:hypothetical protein